MTIHHCDKCTAVIESSARFMVGNLFHHVVLCATCVRPYFDLLEAEGIMPAKLRKDYLPASMADGN